MPLNIPGATPEQLGQQLHREFEAGSIYVHATNLPLSGEALDESREYVQRAASILGHLTLTNDTLGSEVWVLDSATSPNSQFIPYHTDNPYLDEPEQLVSFWNLKSSDVGGENLLLPVSGLVTWAEGEQVFDAVMDEITATSVTFAHNDRLARAPMINLVDMTARFDMKYITPEFHALGLRFAEMLRTYGATLPGIKLQPGEALAFNNRSLLHARAPYVDERRISLRTRVQELAI
ncbi:hypothetical protein BH09PAT3_BH09PAT3_5090 [soil metagenome]